MLPGLNSSERSYLAVDLSPAASRSDRRGSITTLLLYATFAATGAAIVIPGTLLPSLLLRWSLNDAQAGMLFFCFFIGSSTGALLARGRLASSIVRGMVLTSAGIGLLAVSSSISAFPAMLLFGCGLGTAMTSVSLFQSRRRSATRLSEITRLNLVWALGAAGSPALLLRGVAISGLNTVLYSATAIVLVCALLAAWILPGSEPPAPRAALTPVRIALGNVSWMLLAMIPLATGVESSIGAWLSAYSRRGGMMLAATISTVTCFWLGLLLSRLVQSIPGVTATHHRQILRLAPVLMIAGTLLLVFHSGEAAMAGGALLAGLGVGPLYPLILALVLDRGETRNLAFLAGGIGGSALPLLTGVISDRAGSLAVGLGVPLAASFAMGLLALRVEIRHR